MNEYRCTRNQPYQHDCIGREDIGARQGYYIKAKNATDALLVMKREWPNDTAGFTVELFNFDGDSADAKELDERDKRVIKCLRDVLRDILTEEEDLVRQLRDLRAWKQRFSKAVGAGRWWELEGHLANDDIESLCDIDSDELRGALSDD